MVKILKIPPFFEHLKYVYDKPLGYKLNYLWQLVEEQNPTFKYIAIPLTIFSIGFGGLVTYCKYLGNGQPKYYEHVVVMRPDDPRAAYIRKDESLHVQPTRFIGKMYLNI